jgi:hypothetical protein
VTTRRENLPCGRVQPAPPAIAVPAKGAAVLRATGNANTTPAQPQSHRAQTVESRRRRAPHRRRPLLHGRRRLSPSTTLMGAPFPWRMEIRRGARSSQRQHMRPHGQRGVIHAWVFTFFNTQIFFSFPGFAPETVDRVRSMLCPSSFAALNRLV